MFVELKNTDLVKIDGGCACLKYGDARNRCCLSPIVRKAKMD